MAAKSKTILANPAPGNKTFILLLSSPKGYGKYFKNSYFIGS
jgi:hypothetical protein